mmetsp:Transcript_11444/g.22872  ORF Transcript_11444/g.22872 Transcript_11444/m.22872 type:complete len:234 (-) Transcript_11444:1785-2486(-)
MRNAECLVEIQMANISTNHTWSSQSYLGIHVGTIHVDLTTILMDNVADLIDSIFIYTMCRWICNHEGCQVVLVLFCLLTHFANVDISLLVNSNWHNLHSSHDGRGWVGSMSRNWNDTDISVVVSSGLVICPDRHETGIFASCSTVWLERHRIESGDGCQLGSQVLEHFLIPLCLIQWYEWMDVCQLWPCDWNHLRGCVQLHCAGSKRNHRMSEGEIHVLQLLQVTQQFVLSVV